MPTCAVQNCKLRYEPGRKFYRFPKIWENSYLKELSQQRQKAWYKALRLDESNDPKNIVVCQNHFISGKCAKIKDSDHPDWVPSLNMGYVSINNPSTTVLNRFDGAKKRSNMWKTESIIVPHCGNTNLTDKSSTTHTSVSGDFHITDLDETEVNSGKEKTDVKENTDDTASGGTDNTAENLLYLNTNNMCEYNNDNSIVQHRMILKRSIETQTDITMHQMDIDKICIDDLQTEVKNLKDKCKKHSTDLESFNNDDKKALFFTGLASYDHLNNLFNQLKLYLPKDSKKLSQFDVLFIVLFRLRLGIPFMYFAYKFNISHTTVSKYFQIGLLTMYSKLNSLVYWPSRDLLKNTMPIKFLEQFGDKVTIIIDCFEVGIENSSNVEAASQTFSNYKHTNTAKVLIGVSPQGHVCHVSLGYGGRSSDKFVTEDSGFLDKLEIGDVVLADRGFLVSNSVKERGASLVMPVFTKGKSQLHPTEISSSRAIASLRIHVERIIGLIRNKYTILAKRKMHSSNFALNHDICIFDQIVTVCCALINLCPSIILSEHINEVEALYEDSL